MTKFPAYLDLALILVEWDFSYWHLLQTWGAFSLGENITIITYLIFQYKKRNPPMRVGYSGIFSLALHYSKCIINVNTLVLGITLNDRALNLSAKTQTHMTRARIGWLNR